MPPATVTEPVTTQVVGVPHAHAKRLKSQLGGLHSFVPMGEVRAATFSPEVSMERCGVALSKDAPGDKIELPILLNSKSEEHGTRTCLPQHFAGRRQECRKTWGNAQSRINFI